MNKQQLASKIWESANKMRSTIEANDYKDYILGFIFYKFLSETEVTRLKAKDFSDEDLKLLREEDSETVEYVKDECGYFIAYDDLFQTWIEQGNDFSIDRVHTAISAFNRNIHPAHKKLFDGIFETLEVGLSKLGPDARAQSKAARDLIYLIKEIPMDGRQGYDVLGFIYEYLISNFAANAGKKAGEFYTPHEVSLLMSQIVANHLAERENIEIYDPTSGSGSLLINIGKAVAELNKNPNSIKYFAQELKENTYNLTRMNLVMRGILPDNIIVRNGDTLADDWPYFDENDKEGTYTPLFVDAVVSNPPYSQKWDPDSSAENDPRFSYGIAPRSKADYAFLLHDLYHLRNDGIMTIVLPHGVLFRGGEEGQIRKSLVENHNISAIIGLPPNIFFGTGIPTIIMVLEKQRAASDVLIVDASKHFKKVGKNNVLQASDIKRVVDAVKDRSTIEGYSRLVGIEEIRENDYNLNIPRYVDSSEGSESWDVYSLMFGGIPKAELAGFSRYWEAWPSLFGELFVTEDGQNFQIKASDIRAVVEANEDVLRFEKACDEALADVPAQLGRMLIDGVEDVSITAGKGVVSEIVDAGLADRSLIDPYDAYQLIDDAWQQIAIDLEIIQTEGFDAVRSVDPNMVIKKKKGKDVEVQDGWVGHVLPFELVQEKLLSSLASTLDAKERRLAEIAVDYEEALSNLDQEELEQSFVNEGQDAFVAAEVKRYLKEERKYVAEFDAGSTAFKLAQVESLMDEEKRLKKEIKEKRLELHEATKQAIEGLSDEQCRELLREKWITPLHEELLALPQAAQDDFVKQLVNLSEKYGTTLVDIDSQIGEAEKQLSSMLESLVGDAHDMEGITMLQRLLAGESHV